MTGGARAGAPRPQAPAAAGDVGEAAPARRARRVIAGRPTALAAGATWRVRGKCIHRAATEVTLQADPAAGAPYLERVLPFGLSTSVLGLTQAATAGAPRDPDLPALARLRGGGWASIPALSVVVVAFGIRAASATAEGLTLLALVAVPPLAAVALGWAMRGARPWRAALVVPLFALAWADRGGLAGQSAALVLSALSCVTLAVLLGAVAPAHWLKLGIVVMAVVDSALVISDLLQAPNDVLNAAAPPIGLPRLQTGQFGNALMGYGDFFAAALLGAVMAHAPRMQRRAALITAALALSFDLLFLVVRELPATVPVALALLACELAARRRLIRDGEGRGLPALGRLRLPKRQPLAEEDLGGREQVGVQQLGLAQGVGQRNLLNRRAAQRDHAPGAPGRHRIGGGHSEARG
jgi:hypothetical protein